MLISSLIIAALVVLSLITLLWVASLFLKDASIIDIFWGTGFVILVWLYFTLTPEGFTGRKFLIALLTTVWGLRLSVHLAVRNLGKGEDFRYRRWRDAAGSGWWWQSYFKVFVLQGALMWLISIPLLAAQISPTPERFTILDYAGAFLWGIGFCFEAVGDWQLARFRMKPENRDKTYDQGLWRYTRHPNYFGDALLWWGYYIIAFAGGGYWTLISPLVMTFLLWRVSGVRMLERTLVKTKPGYERYIRNTNAFFPWFPRDKEI